MGKAVKRDAEDRLSSLPDNILIRILSGLPLGFVIATGSLSPRWRNVWKNLTSIDATNLKYGVFAKSTFTEFCAVFSNIIMQIGDHHVHSFSLEFIDLIYDEHWNTSLVSLFRQICDHHVRELKVTSRRFYSSLRLPRFIFQTASLVSLDLDSDQLKWELPNDGDRVNLPNLGKLKLNVQFKQCKCLEKLVMGCPSLEELSIKFDICKRGEQVKCSNQNLRRLCIDLGLNEGIEVGINAPKLEYLSFLICRSFNLYFEEEQSLLREARFEIAHRNLSYCNQLDESMLVPMPFDPIANVRFLTLDAVAAFNASATTFCFLNHLTINMKECHNINTVLPLIQVCPALDTLTLKFKDISKERKARCNFLKTVDASKLQGLKRIEIEIAGSYCWKPLSETFTGLVEYLLSNTIDLKYFRFRMSGGKCDSDKIDVELRQRELMLCKLLYHCPMASIGSEVEFVGRCYNMSRKAGPKVWSADGDVVPLSLS